MSKSTDNESLQDTILEFIKNRAKDNESTASRHIHRRFDIPMEEADQILSKLADKNTVEEFYDEEYQENRYSIRI